MLYDKIRIKQQKRGAYNMEKEQKYYQRLRDLREDRDLKQSEIAKLLGLTNQQAYQRYESGRVELPMRYFIKLAIFYNVSLDYIAGLTNDKRGIGYTDKAKEQGKYNINQNNSGGKNIIKIKE